MYNKTLSDKLCHEYKRFLKVITKIFFHKLKLIYTQLKNQNLETLYNKVCDFITIQRKITCFIYIYIYIYILNIL